MSYILYIALMALSGWGIIEFLPVLASFLFFRSFVR